MKSVYFWDFIIVISLATDILTDPIGFSNCPADIETTGIVSNVLVYGCNSLPCVFRKGESYPIEIDFECYKNTTTLTPEVYGLLNGVPTPWTGIDPVGCDYMMIGTCPLNTNDYVTWGYKLEVLPLYPTIAITVRWHIFGDDGKSIFCFEFPVSVR